MLSSLHPRRKFLQHHANNTLKSQVTVCIIMLVSAVIILEKDLWWAAASVTSVFVWKSGAAGSERRVCSASGNGAQQV